MDRDRIYILKEHREIYKKMNSRSAFRKSSNSEIFMLALGLGLRAGERRPFASGTRDGLVMLSSFPRKYDALVRAIAISEKGVAVLGDPDALYTIGEEYANAGAELLVDLSSKQSDAIIANLEQIMIGHLKKT